jgi:arylsulfatase A-like enzyme
LNETPFRVDVTLRFADEGLVMDREYNVALGTQPTRKASLVGRPIDPLTR